MKITTDLTEEDYLVLIEEARGDILNHTSHKPIKMIIGNYEIIADMQCLGVKISDSGRTIEGKFIPPIMKFGFRISFESDNEIMEAWRNRIIKINYQYVPSFNEVLRLNQLFDIHFSNQKLQNIHYDKERNVFYVNYDLLFMAIIEDYLKNGKKINNGLVESYRDAGKSTTLISEMNLIGINLNSNEEMIITECFDDRYLRGSVILLDSQYNHYFEKWLGNDKKWKLIYRASKYNYTAKSFHKYCDDKGPTLVIIESTEGWIFGGYTTQSWSGDSICYKIIL